MKTAYTRLPLDERRRLLLDAGRRLFAEHAFEEISMQDIAAAAGISKALLYHYFPSKTALFKAAVQEHAEELEALVDLPREGDPLVQLAATVDAYLAWIQAHARTWAKLMQSASTLPEARDLVQTFRARTLTRILERLTDQSPQPALRTALNGWLGYIDAAILDWIDAGDLTRDQLRDLILAGFAASLLAAQQVDPTITLALA